MGGGGPAADPPPFDGMSKNIHLSSTFGGQKSSSRRTAPAFGFGAATREVANKVFVSQEHTALATAGMHSPGPAKYVLPPSIGGTQPEGRKASAPSYGFSKGSRFMVERVSDRTPGPGAGGFHPAIGPQPVGRFPSAPMAGFGTGTRQQRSKLFISQEHNSMVKVAPWQRPSSAPVPPQGAPGGSRQLGTPKKRPTHWAPSHCLGCLS